MDIIQSAASRYSTKAFDPSKKITAENIEKVKDLLRLSPSSTNSQPWHFILASTPEAKARIAKATSGFYVFNERKVLDASHVVVFCAKRRLMKRIFLNCWTRKMPMAVLPASRRWRGSTKAVPIL